MTTPRRTRVPRHPGIYYREVDGRRRYEISYRDSSARQRWEVVNGNLETAEALRDERRGQKRRGELTAPAGVLFRDVRDRYLDSPQFKRLAATTRYTYANT